MRVSSRDVYVPASLSNSISMTALALPLSRMGDYHLLRGTVWHDTAVMSLCIHPLPGALVQGCAGGCLAAGVLAGRQQVVARPGGVHQCAEAHHPAHLRDKCALCFRSLRKSASPPSPDAFSQTALCTPNSNHSASGSSCSRKAPHCRIMPPPARGGNWVAHTHALRAWLRAGLRKFPSETRSTKHALSQSRGCGRVLMRPQVCRRWLVFRG